MTITDYEPVPCSCDDQETVDQPRAEAVDRAAQAGLEAALTEVPYPAPPAGASNAERHAWHYGHREGVKRLQRARNEQAGLPV